MPIDIFVDPVSGIDNDDAARGGMATPYRSLARAAQRAAAEELAAGLPPGAFIGTIHARAGVYEPPTERFPIIVPPGFDLIGAGRDLTEIRFTGETRTRVVGGRRITYWGGDAVYVGRHLRSLTLRANPAPSYDCFGMHGFRCQNGGSIVEDVHVDLDVTAAAPPDGQGLYEGGFRAQLWAHAIELTMLDCLFEHARRGRWGVLADDCTGLIVRTAFDRANLSIVGTSTLIVDACTARNHTWFIAGDGVTIQNCTLGDSAERLQPAAHIGGPMSRFGPGNDAHLESMSASGGAEVSQNIFHLHDFFVFGSTRIINNEIIARPGAFYLLSVRYSRRSSGAPVLQGNTFAASDPPRRGAGHSFHPIRVEGSADFGGGVSAGRNNFDRLFAYGGASRSQILIDASNDPGAVIRFDDNFWHDPGEIVRRSRFDIVSPPAILTAENPMRAMGAP